MINKAYQKSLISITLFMLSAQSMIANAKTNQPPSAAPGFQNKPSSEPTLNEVQGRVETTTSLFVDIVIWSAIIIGLILFIKSLLKLSKIANGESNDSAFGAFLGLFFGGMLTALVTWIKFFRASSEELVGLK